MTAQWESECHWMRLIDLEGETNFTLQNRSNSSVNWRVKILGFVYGSSFFSLPTAFRLSRVGWLHVLAFRSIYSPWGNMGTTCSLCFLSFTETNRWTCLNSICTLSSGSQMLKHVPNFRPFYLFYLFFFLESRISQLMSQYWKLLSGASAIYHSNFTLWPLSNVILKQNWVRMKAS